MNMQPFCEELLTVLKQDNLSKPELHKLKIKLSKKYNLRRIPTDIEVFLNSPYEDRKLLITKPVRTISGVAVIALMTICTLITEFAIFNFREINTIF